jgi:hypothetical protein
LLKHLAIIKVLHSAAAAAVAAAVWRKPGLRARLLRALQCGSRRHVELL